MGTEPRQYCWEDVAAEDLSPALRRRMVWGHEVMLARVELKKGAVVPVHRHVHEQWSCVQQGLLRLVAGEEERVYDVRPGEMLYLPSNAPHAAEALEDTVVLDVFSPPREDWIGGADSYLRSPR